MATVQGAPRRSARGWLSALVPLAVLALADDCDAESECACSRDSEGFSAGSHQFDSDITAERHPRAAIGLTEDRILAVACDGRSRTEAGMTLEEMGEVLAALGARSAMNLDGGGSTTLIAGGRLRNRPRAGVNRPEPGGRGIATAIVFVSRD